MDKLVLALFAAVSLVACGEGAAPAGDVTAASAGASQDVSSSKLTPSPDGLIVSGATPREIRFGTPKAVLLSAVNAVLGPPTLPEGVNPNCPTGPVTVIDWNGLSAILEDDRFAGWLIREGALETASGLGVASSRREIEAGPGYRLHTDSTLGSEFSVDGVGGFYKAEGPDAGIELLFAGLTCFAR